MCTSCLRTLCAYTLINIDLFTQIRIIAAHCKIRLNGIRTEPILENISYTYHYTLKEKYGVNNTLYSVFDYFMRHILL